MNTRIPTISESMDKETKAISVFTGYNIKVPLPPDEVTIRLYENWYQDKFHLHFLPDIDLTHDKNYPGWHVKPNDWFYQQIREGKLSPDSTKLPGKWCLYDARPKPAYNKNKQMYKNDDKIGNVLKELRNKGIIENNPDYTIRSKKKSRFNVTWDGLHKTEILNPIAEILEVNPQSIRLPRAIENNYLANVFYPEWGDTNTYEWLEDKYNEIAYLGGGYSDYYMGLFDYGVVSYYSGLSKTEWYNSDYCSEILGFRYMVVFD